MVEKWNYPVVNVAGRTETDVLGQDRESPEFNALDAKQIHVVRLKFTEIRGRYLVGDEYTLLGFLSTGVPEIEVEEKSLDLGTSLRV